MPSKAKTYITLFTSAFYISAVTFGSGYVIVSVIKKRFVDELQWIDEREMMNLIALAQSSPGVMTANTALLVGYKICGAPGAFLAVLGVALPPLITIYIISSFYSALRDNGIVKAALKGMQAGACAVITDVVVSMLTSVIKEKTMRTGVKASIMISAFAAAFIFKINYILIVLAFIVIGVTRHYVNSMSKGRGNGFA